MSESGTSRRSWDWSRGQLSKGNRTTPRNRRQRPRGVVQSRRVSQLCRLRCVAGCGIIRKQRKSSAHLHRPWCANLCNDVAPPPRIICRSPRALLGLRARVRSTSAIDFARRGPPRWRLTTRAFWGFSRPYDISSRGLNLPSISGFWRCHLRHGADLPQGPVSSDDRPTTTRLAAGGARRRARGMAVLGRLPSCARTLLSSAALINHILGTILAKGIGR